MTSLKLAILCLRSHSRYKSSTARSESVHRVSGGADPNYLLERLQVILAKGVQILSPEELDVVASGEGVEDVVLPDLPPEGRPADRDCDLIPHPRALEILSLVLDLLHLP